MPQNIQPIPEGYHTLTPYLTVKDAGRAIEFYKRAFGAEELFRMPTPNGKVAHAELRIGDSIFMLSDECPQMGSFAPTTAGGAPVKLHLYVENVDAVFNRAVQSGAQAAMPPNNMFWGDRMAKITDPFGHSWGIATHIEDVTPEECARRAQAEFAGAAQG